MASGPQRDILRPPLLDRLIGPPSDHRGQIGIGFDDLRKSVTRDLTWLLNTRTLILEEWARLEEARKSVLTYGVPDFANAGWIDRSDHNAIASLITQAIQTFEPRLVPRTVSVKIQPPQEGDQFRLRFRITAELHVEPVREQVAFETNLDTKSGGFSVAGSF